MNRDLERHHRIVGLFLGGDDTVSRDVEDVPGTGILLFVVVRGDVYPCREGHVQNDFPGVVSPGAEGQVARLLVKGEVGDVDGARAFEDAVRIVVDFAIRSHDG